jgi:hypothetical protein
MQQDARIQTVLSNDSPEKIRQQIIRYYIANPPQTEDELYAWVYGGLGWKIPRKAICPGHSSPFDAMSAAYFERDRKVLWHANRTGGKTMNVALLNVSELLFKGGIEAVTVGGSLLQANKGYTYTQETFKENPYLLSQFANPRSDLSKNNTKLVNGSLLKILAGSIKSVHHDHVERLRLDEIDSMDREVFEGAQSIPMSRKGFAGTIVGTSTWFKTYGLMADLVNKGLYNYKLYRWCYKEIAERCTDERSGTVPTTYYINKPAQAVISEARFKQNAQSYGGYYKHAAFDKCEHCALLFSCCGDLKRADGYYTIDDLLDKVSAEKSVWVSQWECGQPYKGGLVFPMFDTTLHCKPVVYDPRLPLYCSMDFGFAQMYYACWFQVTPLGHIYVIDEYATNNKILDHIAYELKNKYKEDADGKKHYYHHRCKYHGDPYSGSQRDQIVGLNPRHWLWKRHHIKVILRRVNERNIQEFIRTKLIGLNGVPHIYINREKCPLLVNAFTAYHLKVDRFNNPTEEPEKDGVNDHPIDGFKYGVVNVFNIGGNIIR